MMHRSKSATEAGLKSFFRKKKRLCGNFLRCLMKLPSGSMAEKYTRIAMSPTIRIIIHAPINMLANKLTLSVDADLKRQKADGIA